jgi:hypothetical protein
MSCIDDEDEFIWDEAAEKSLDEQFDNWLKRDERTPGCSGACGTCERYPTDKECGCKKEDKCTCSKETIFNKGCQCGYVERRKKAGLPI